MLAEARPQHIQRLGLCLAIAIVLVVAPARAQRCEDEKIETLSEDWFLAQLDCGADAGIAAGKDVLTNLGKELVVQGLAFIAPGSAPLLSMFNLLEGGSEDPFAAHAQAIMDHVDEAKEEVIEAIVRESKYDAQLTMATVKTTLADYNDDPLSLQISNRAVYHGMVMQLREARIALQWPVADRIDYDVNDLTTADVSHLHAYGSALALLASILPKDGLFQHYSARETERGVIPLNAITPTEWSIINERAAVETVSDLELDLYGEYGLYHVVEEMAERDLVRRASDERFSNVQHSPIGACFPPCCVLAGDRWLYTMDGSGGAPVQYEVRLEYDTTIHVCDGQSAPAVGGTMKHVDPSGNVFRESHLTAQQVNNSTLLAQQWVESHQLTSYMRFIIQAYGPIRPALTRWSEMIGDDRSANSLDNDLHLALAFSGAPVGNALEAFYEMLSQNTELTDMDVIRLYDRFLDGGVDQINYMAVGITFGDRLRNGGVPIENLRPMLRSKLSNPEIARLVKSQFAAKMVSVM